MASIALGFFAFRISHLGAKIGLSFYSALFALIAFFWAFGMVIRWRMRKRLAASHCPGCKELMGLKGASEAFEQYKRECLKFIEESKGFFSIDLGWPMHLNCPSCQRRLWFAYMSDASLSVTDGSMNLEDVLRLGMTLRDEVFRVHEGAARKLLGPTPPEGIPIRRFQPVVMTDLDKTPASFCFGEPGEVILQLICSEPDASPKHERTVYGVLLRSSGERGEDMQSKVEAYLATEGVQWTGLDLEAFLESASQSDK